MGGTCYITKDQIFEMLKKYNIGKKPLAKLAGWGETTIIFYCQMDELPKNGHTERLYRLYSDKKEYLELLVNNKANLTPVAFRKSMMAIYKQILENKILYISQYVFDRSKTKLTQAHLDVVLFMSQALSLRFLDKPMFDDIYQPVRGGGNSPYKAVVDAYRSNAFFYFEDDHEKFTMSELLSPFFKIDVDKMISDDEKEILDYVIEMLSWYGEKAFVSLLAAERFRLFGPPTSKVRRSISNDTLKKLNSDFFDQAKIKKMKDFDSFVSKRVEALRKKMILTEENKETGKD